MVAIRDPPFDWPTPLPVPLDPEVDALIYKRAPANGQILRITRFLPCRLRITFETPSRSPFLNFPFRKT